MKNIFLATIFALITSCAWGQTQSTYLDEYRRMALSYNYDLKTAEKNIAASAELERMARADTKPKLSAEANFQYLGNPTELNVNLPTLNDPLSFRGQNMSYGASLSLLQPVYTAGRILETIRMQGHRHSMATFSADVVRSAVCFQTDIQYWSTVERAEMVGIATDFRNSISAFVATIKERVEVGVVDAQDLLMAQVKLNQADYLLLEAQNNLHTGIMALNSIIGVDLKDSTAIESVIPVVVVDDSLLTLQGENRAEIAVARSKMRIAESSAKVNDSKYLPQLYVGADLQYGSPGYDFNKDLDPNYALYAKLSVPIFEWNKRRSEQRFSASQVGAQYDFLRKTEDNVRLEVQTSRVALRQAIDRSELALSSLDKAYQNERMALERYDQGKVSVVEVIQAQTYRLNSQVNYTKSKAAAQVHYAEFTRAVALY